MSKDEHDQGEKGPSEQPTQTLPVTTQPEGAAPPGLGPGFAPTPVPALASGTSGTLSNWISLAAVGVMALIAALGLLIFFSALGGGGFSGQPILFSVGAIVLVAGGVLIYAALKGLKAGWFLPFTIVGALIAVPVGAIGAGMTAYSTSYIRPGSWVEEDWSSQTWEEEDWSGQTWEEGTSPGHDRGSSSNLNSAATRVEPTETSIIGSSERLVLDLTQVEDVHDMNYQVSLDNSEMIVLLTDDQLPLVPNWSIDDTSFVEGRQPLGFHSDDSGFGWQFQEWIDSGFNAASYPFELGQAGSDPDATFAFNLTLNNGSLLRFEVVNEDVFGHWPRNTDSNAPMDAPQSGATTQERDAKHNTDGGN